MALTREQFKGRLKKRVKTIAVEGIGDLCIRKLGAGRLVKLVDAVHAAQETGKESDILSALVASAAQFLCDDNGGTFLTEEDADILNDLSLDELTTIFNESVSFCGFSDDKLKEQEKN